MKRKRKRKRKQRTTFVCNETQPSYFPLTDFVFAVLIYIYIYIPSKNKMLCGLLRGGEQALTRQRLCGASVG